MDTTAYLLTITGRWECGFRQRPAQKSHALLGGMNGARLVGYFNDRLLKPTQISALHLAADLPVLSQTRDQLPKGESFPPRQRARCTPGLKKPFRYPDLPEFVEVPRTHKRAETIELRV